MRFHLDKGLISVALKFKSSKLFIANQVDPEKEHDAEPAKHSFPSFVNEYEFIGDDHCFLLYFVKSFFHPLEIMTI
jgi:hypothetical protein